jgi:hypothetical protein
MRRTGLRRFIAAPARARNTARLRRSGIDRLTLAQHVDRLCDTQRKALAWKELARETLVLLIGRSSVRALAEQHFAAAGSTTQPTYDVAGMVTALAMVRVGLGVTVPPRISLGELNMAVFTSARFAPPRPTPADRHHQAQAAGGNDFFWPTLGDGSTGRFRSDAREAQGFDERVRARSRQHRLHSSGSVRRRRNALRRTRSAPFSGPAPAPAARARLRLRLPCGTSSISLWLRSTAISDARLKLSDSVSRHPA